MLQVGNAFRRSVTEQQEPRASTVATCAERMLSITQKNLFGDEGISIEYVNTPSQAQ
jgi:hypothetical protein